MHRVFDRNALSLGVEQRVDRQAATTFTQSDDNPMCAWDGPQPMVHRAQEWHAVFEHPARLSRFGEIQNPVSSPLFHLSGDRSRERALTQHENVFYEGSNG
jgi:hypothetical protein